MNVAFAIVKRSRRVAIRQIRRGASCGLQRLAAGLVAACLTILAAAGPARATAAFVDSLPPIAPDFERPPLESIRLVAGFGEARPNHIHVGLDLSTQQHTGMPVHAPTTLALERVRGSGIGYGRSLYFRAPDGRLIEFGHLDAYAPDIAAYVDSVQCATGQYEQDLWPPVGRFRFATGDVVAWSGQSGAGPPHLHVEVRHGDFALDPLRAGLPGPAYAPRLFSVALEPLDEASWVNGVAAPAQVVFGARPETLVVQGRVRAVVRARAGWPGIPDTPAWSTTVRWRGTQVEMRVDSISWAGEMSQLDEMIDRGRVVGGEGLLVWAPAGWRPRFLRSDAPLAEEAGTIEVAPGDPPRALEIVARDEHGMATARTLVLRGPSAAEAGPRELRARAGRGTPVWSFASLPGGALRVVLAHVPALAHGATIGRGAPGVRAWPASRRGDSLIVVLPASPGPGTDGFSARGRRAGGSGWTLHCDAGVWPAGGDSPVRPADFASLSIPSGAVYEPGLIVSRVLARPAAQGLTAASVALDLSPARYPLRRAVSVRMQPPPGAEVAGLGIYHVDDSGGWEYLGGDRDSVSGAIVASSATLGTFALFRDTTPPQLVGAPAPRDAAPQPYSRWALVARVSEHGSGIDARGSAFTIGGVRVPSEWDPEARELRWRPRERPQPGAYDFQVELRDRAGNLTQAEGHFVLDSTTVRERPKSAPRR